jgi:hypothetical protein
MNQWSNHLELMENQREIEEAEAKNKEILSDLEVLNSCYEEAKETSQEPAEDIKAHKEVLEAQNEEHKQCIVKVSEEQKQQEEKIKTLTVSGRTSPKTQNNKIDSWRPK